MTYRTAGITVLEGLEAVRRRPAMYIGDEIPGQPHSFRLVESALDAVSTDSPAPTAVRLLMWKDNVFTIAFDGEPLPIGPFAFPADGVPHPELYRFFMYVAAVQRPLAFAGGVLNALSERLVVSTMSGGHRYRAVFAKGSLLSLLTKTTCAAPLGTTWLTFRPDPSIVGGTLTTTDGLEITKRVAKGSENIGFEDRITEEADWW